MNKSKATNIELAEKLLLFQLDWIKTSESKVPSIFAINMAMIGVEFALIKTAFICSLLPILAIIICLSGLILSIVFLALCIFPQLDGPDSNIFFGSIIKKSEKDYIKSIKNLSEIELEHDLLKQTYRNAQIAATKYKNAKRASMATFIVAPFWLLSIYLLSF